jgi:exopolyphosphatase/pppGpp-phosphohydrolase
MTLTLRDAWRDPIASRALGELARRYTVAEESSGLVLTQKTGNMKLFLNDVDDLHQWDFVRNQRLRESLHKIGEQRESWKHRALVAEARLIEASANAGKSDRGQNVSDLRYAALKRYLAKQLHPDHAPGHGIEKIVRNEIFKEIWGEIDRMNHQSASECSTAGREARSRQSA